MKYILTTLILFFLYVTIQPCIAQEKKYKQALDSLSHYLNYSSGINKVRLLTFYNPGMQNEMSEQYDSMNYLGFSYNIKTKIVISTGNTLYMLNLPIMDSTKILQSPTFIIIKDLDNSNCLYHSAESRIFNGKYGGVPIGEIQIPLLTYRNDSAIESQQQFVYLKKIEYYLKEAILYSKKVKTKKKDVWNSEKDIYKC